MEPTEENLRAWNEIHAARGSEEALPAEIVAHLPELSGRHVLQLGGDANATKDLMARGALVTAVSSEPETVEDVRDHAAGAAPVQADLNELPLELRRGRFDVVYAGFVLAEVTDVRGFAAGAAAALRDGGVLVLHDEHPVALALDEAGLGWREDYFAPGRLRLGELVTAILHAGLAVSAVEEHPSLYRRRLRNRRIPGDVVIVAAKA